ncbi:hypothetical protein V496_06813 [Pseudogymnoascus sp. VKM F-4515 (FW-2607)]|nr:hypothetical protein V496_06813 [Pseudogymnoascus sp. VKM F-4515 (FW-2607)]
MPSATKALPMGVRTHESLRVRQIPVAGLGARCFTDGFTFAVFVLCFGCSGATWAANEANATNETGWAGISICVDTRLIKLYNAFTISFHFFVQAGCTYAVGTIGSGLVRVNTARLKP